MSGTNTAPRLTGRPTSAGRLLAAEGPGLAAHLDCYGARPRGSAALVGEVERSGLRGRGGAGFPMAVKLASVTGRRRVVVVANGTEGEPLSAKDKTLMMTAPHLVIDGVAIAAET